MSIIAKRSALKVLGAAAVIGSGLLAADASANLKFDIVAVSATGGATVSADGKSVTGATAGTVVTYNVVANITGAAATNPGFLSAAGAIRSSTGAGFINGNLTHTNDAVFSTGAFLNGTPTADANGFTQIGPAGALNNATTGRVSYLAATMVSGASIRIGGGTYTVASLNGATSTGVSFVIATTTATNKNPTWRENVTSGVNAGSGTLDVAAPLVISGGSVSNTPTLSLVTGSGTADLAVTGNGNGYTPGAVAFAGAAAGAKLIGFTPANPGTVIVGLDLNGSASDIAALITTLGLTANPTGKFFGLGGTGVYDAIATFTVPAGGSFNFAWSNFGNVSLQGIAAIPEPTGAAGLLGVAALAARRRRA
jgi:hypothetical protein